MNKIFKIKNAKKHFENIKNDIILTKICNKTPQINIKGGN